jgi:hypothetical protein
MDAVPDGGHSSVHYVTNSIRLHIGVTTFMPSACGHWPGSVRLPPPFNNCIFELGFREAQSQADTETGAKLSEFMAHNMQWLSNYVTASTAG